MSSQSHLPAVQAALARQALPLHRPAAAGAEAVPEVAEQVAAGKITIH